MRTAYLITLAVAMAVLLGSPCQVHATLPDYATPMQLNGNTTPDPAVSNIDDYTQQREHLNLDPDSGAVRILRTNEKVMLNDFVSAIIPLKNASPRELRGPIRTIVRKEGGEADVLQDKVSKENFLQVTCPSFQLPYLQKALQALDESWVRERMDGSAELYYPMRFREVDKVYNITRFYVSPEFVFRIDKTNNALYYRDQHPTIGLQKKGLSEVDIPPNQMMLDVAIYEVATANNLLAGLDFVSWKNGPGRNLFEGFFGYAKSVLQENLGSGSADVTAETKPHFLGTFNAVVVSSYVDFLRTKGKARLLNRAQVTAKNKEVLAANPEARFSSISSLDQLVTFQRRQLPTPPAPPAKDRYFNVNDPDAVPPTVKYNLPDYHEPSMDYAKAGAVGVNVKIYPIVGRKSSEVEVVVDVSDVTGFTPSGTPIIKARQVSSKVRLYPGEPFVVAGLTRKSTISSTAKVPVLGSIPVLGWLFGHETESTSEGQVVIVLTPQVSLDAESVIAMPESARTAVAIVSSDSALPEVPQNSYGFDQWLLDSE